MTWMEHLKNALVILCCKMIQSVSICYPSYMLKCLWRESHCCAASWCSVPSASSTVSSVVYSKGPGSTHFQVCTNSTPRYLKCQLQLTWAWNDMDQWTLVAVLWISYVAVAPIVTDWDPIHTGCVCHFRDYVDYVCIICIYCQAKHARDTQRKLFAACPQSFAVACLVKLKLTTTNHYTSLTYDTINLLQVSSWYLRTM